MVFNGAFSLENVHRTAVLLDRGCDFQPVCCAKSTGVMQEFGAQLKIAGKLKAAAIFLVQVPVVMNCPSVFLWWQSWYRRSCRQFVTTDRCPRNSHRLQEEFA